MLPVDKYLFKVVIKTIEQPFLFSFKCCYCWHRTGVYPIAYFDFPYCTNACSKLPMKTLEAASLLHRKAKIDFALLF